MTLPYRKKLIEVALPLKAINEASAREKSIRHGHPSTLHLWWARRPLAACRAVLFSSLVDDPDSDPAYRKSDGSVDEDRAGIKRAELFNLIEELVQWDNSNNPRVINAARAEIARCVASQKIELGEFQKDTIIFGHDKGQAHPNGPVSGEGVTAWEVLLMKARPQVVNAFLAEYAPPVLDPFCGGGSIPLEAQRLGLRPYASDLNPVPVLITKALIEIPPKFAGRPPVNPEWQSKSEAEKAATVWQGAHGLAEDVRYYGQWMRDEAEKRIGHLYPKVKISDEMTKDRPDLKEYVGQDLTVIAWLWARTVASPNPACRGAHVPLVRSFWLSTKKGKEAYVRPILNRSTNTCRFEVRAGPPTAGFDPKKGTVARTGATCLLTGSPVSFDHIRTEGKAGRLGAQLMAVVAEGNRGRVYLPPRAEDEIITAQAKPHNVPDTSLPEQALGFRVQLYGMTKHRDLFTSRQLVALTAFSDLVGETRCRALDDAAKAGVPNEGPGPIPYADSIATYIGLCASKASAFHCSLGRWRPNEGKSAPAFGRQTVSMVWDYAEVNPFAGAGGDLSGIVDGTVRTLLGLPAQPLGACSQLDSAASLPEVLLPVVSTDPPYYDNIGYADLSDFFYIWLRRALAGVHPQLFATLLTPKAQELIAIPSRHNGNKERAREFFEGGLAQAFAHVRDVQNPNYPLTVYYAFKQAEEDEDDEDESSVATTSVASTGWETMLASLCHSGFSVTGTWPVRTEGVSRMRSMGSNALASSIVLVTRARAHDAPLATRKQFMTALRRELPEALKNLQHGNIAPVDLAQAAIGPGMAVFTRYSKVVESDGKSMTVRTALGIINQVLDEVLSEQEGDFDPDTRWALAWFEQYGTSEGPYGVAETLSKAKNTAIKGLEEAGIVEAGKGKVQLLGRTDLHADWNPATDKRLTVWETTQHLIRTLETKGESEAATLLNKLGGIVEIARELAYRLYSICERKKWADDALAYNGLVIAWPELSKLALSQRNRQPTVQQDLF